MTLPFYGKGLTYPIQLDTTESRLLLSEGEEVVKQSMRNILLTGVTERPFVSQNGIPYGTRIRNALFADFDTASDILRYESKRALDLWEPRIIVTGVSVTEQEFDSVPHIVSVVFFRFRATNRDDNLVIPYRYSRTP